MVADLWGQEPGNQICLGLAVLRSLSASSRTGTLGSRVGAPRLPGFTSAAPCALLRVSAVRRHVLSLKLTAAFLPDPKRFTQSMKLDGELGGLVLERGTVLGPPTEAERAEERVRKELARKVCGDRLLRRPAAGLHCFPSG